MQNDFDAISSKIRLKIDKLTSLINKTDQTINHLYDENALIDDREARISNKGAIDLHNDIVKTQRDTVELVVDISQACLELHKKTDKELGKLKPFVDAQETTSNIRTFLVWLGGFSALVLFAIYAIKHVKIV